MSTPVSDPKRRALGRGLDALLPAAREQAPAYGDKSVFSCALEKLTPQKGQPRQYFAKDKIEELKQEEGRFYAHFILVPVRFAYAGGVPQAGDDADEVAWWAPGTPLPGTCSDGVESLAWHALRIARDTLV